MPPASDKANGYGLRTPADWWECTLSDVCNTNGGVIQTGPFGSQLHAHDYKETGTPVVMPQQLGDNRITTVGIARISDEDVDRLKRHCLRRGDIVFSRRGDVTRRAFITPREEGWLCGTGCMLIRPHHPKVCNEYLAFFFSLHEVKEYIVKQAVGATMPNLNTGILEAIPLFLPSRDSQEKVVSLLSTYDDLIENNTRRIAILEAMAQAIYREWFVEFRFPGHEKVKLVDSPLGKIPDGWGKQLGDVVTLKRGYDLPQRDRRAGEFPLVSSSGITDFHDEAMVTGPGVVTGRYGTLGEVFYIPTDFWPLNTTLYVRNFHGNELLLVVHLLRSLNLASQNAAGAVPGVNRNALHLLEVAFPPSNLQKQIAPAFEAIEKSRTNLQSKNANLRKTRDLLLPKLISGQLDVENLDIDNGEAAP